MQVVFRTDASLVMGTGHVMRCLTLANALRERGAEVSFICREHEGHLCDLIEGRGFKVGRLTISSTGADNGPSPDHASWLGASWQEDLEQTVAAIESGARSPDWLVVDHYAIDRRWESGIRGRVGRLMVIDDLADREHDCDLLLDQNYFPDREREYRRLVPESCVLALGPNYALLRPEFEVQRTNKLERDGRVRRVLVSFGGGDATGETFKVLEMIKSRAYENIMFDFVTGHSASLMRTVENLCANAHNVRVLGATDHMADLMCRADLAIGASGATNWERCCLGLPALIISTAANQHPIAINLEKTGAVVHLGEASKISAEMIGSSIDTLRADPTRMAEMSRAGLALVDGRGAFRAADKILGLT